MASQNPEEGTEMRRGPPRGAHALVPRWAESSPFDELDGFERFVHVSGGDREAEVKHGVLNGPIAALQPDEVSQWSPAHHVGDAAAPRVPRVFPVCFSWLKDKGHRLRSGQGRERAHPASAQDARPRGSVCR